MFFEISSIEAKINIYQRDGFSFFTGIDLPVLIVDDSFDFGFLMYGFVNYGNIFLGINYRIPLASGLYLKPSASVQLYPLFLIYTVSGDGSPLFAGARADLTVEYYVSKSSYIYFAGGAEIFPDDYEFAFEFIFSLELGLCITWSKKKESSLIGNKYNF